MPSDEPILASLVITRLFDKGRTGRTDTPFHLSLSKEGANAF
jgi:hypothetical protein